MSAQDLVALVEVLSVLGEFEDLLPRGVGTLTILVANHGSDTRLFLPDDTNASACRLNPRRQFSALRVSAALRRTLEHRTGLMQRPVLVLETQPPSDGEDRRPHLMRSMANPDFAFAAAPRKTDDLGDLWGVAELVEPLAESRLLKLFEVGRKRSEQLEVGAVERCEYLSQVLGRLEHWFCLPSRAAL